MPPPVSYSLTAARPCHLPPPGDLSTASNRCLLRPRSVASSHFLNMTGHRDRVQPAGISRAGGRQRARSILLAASWIRPLKAEWDR